MKNWVFFLSFLVASVLFAEGPYASPGITSYQEGEWVGSDHLLQVKMPILVSVEVNSQENVPSISSKEIEKIALETLKNEGIPIGTSFSNSSFQPFLHILILALKAPEAVAFSVNTRLFEEMHSDRIHLNKDIFFQAITWDHQSLHIASDEEFKKELISSVKETLTTFASRLKRFQTQEEMKQKAEETQEEFDKKAAPPDVQKPVFKPYPKTLPPKKSS